MTFDQIERIIGTALPPSAREYPPWWSNNATNHVQARSWLDAGFLAQQIDKKGGKVVFRRALMGNEKPASGLEESPREFKSADSGGEKKPRRSPLFGAMKGTFTIEPGWDLTRPAMDPEEWEEILEAKLAKYDKLFAELSETKK